MGVSGRRPGRSVRTRPLTSSGIGTACRSPAQERFPAMALRLTTSAITTGPPSPAELAGPSRRGCSPPVTRDAYRKLFERAAEHEDVNRRYHARVLLLEAGLGAAAEAPAHSAAKIFLTVAQAGIDADRGRAARAAHSSTTPASRFYELWSLDAARSLFKATLDLDPEIPHTRRNLAECKRRAKAAPGRQPGARTVGDARTARQAGQARRAPSTSRGRAHAEPVHDRPGRGGDASSLPGGGRRTRSTRS